MSRTPTAIAHPKPAAAPAKRRLHPVRISLILLLALAGSLTIPQVFQTVLGWAAKIEAWRRGGTVRIEKTEGSLWEPVILSGAYFHMDNGAGAITRVEIRRAELHFNWVALFRRNRGHWLERATLRGVTGKVNIPVDRVGGQERKATWRDWLPTPSAPQLPAAVEAQEINFVFQSNGDYVRVEDASFAASSTEAGELSVPQLTISQPWLRRSFRNVRGKAALQGVHLTLANVELEPGVKLGSLTTRAVALARGELDVDANFAAFDGRLRVFAATKLSSQGALFEASGQFGEINIGKLASFLALSEAAGGIINDGNFKFRGPPRDLARAQASLRFDAVNFQWETRQWDSLTLGLTLMDRRVTVPEFDLRQGRNELHLSGELALPDAGRKWWQGDFTTTVDARIENLTELSALLLPEFKYAAGRATVEGSIRGRGEEFNGQLLVSGSNITWRNAPIDTLHAAVKLSGKEVQVANVELVHGDDYLRGRGLVRFSNPPVYWGELRVVVEDLTTYAAFLQKPVLPEPLAGGAIIDWTGEGSREGNSGKFLARLRKVRTLGALAEQLHPINADLEATYQSEAMQFSRFSLSDNDSVFTANIAVGGKALHLRDLRFVHRGATQLEGDALLPLDIWQQWPNVSFSQMLSREVVSHVQLVARELNLEAAARLSGWKFPVAGFLDGTFSADGPVGALRLDGALALKQGRLPLDWHGTVLEGASARLVFRDDTVQIEQFAARHPLGPMAIGGSVRLHDLLDPALALTLQSERAIVRIDAGRNADARLALTLTGPVSAALIGGEATIVPWVSDVPEPAFTLAPPTIRLPRFFILNTPPWKGWRYNLGATIDGIPGHVLGSASAPVWLPRE